ncbi:hypothetical protein [Pseudorhodobacter aquimaris]|uniref:hypothetical protein n=1 Tax=Pseudorhodobacter aquimaris TaxID=687412 RepID=UPI000B206083|nr:hypothetical protein [Pseudorhodobacter aquimaris]
MNAQSPSLHGAKAEREVHGIAFLGPYRGHDFCNTGGGLSTAEVLGRNQGRVLWFLFYGSLVIAASIHGAIGLRVIVHKTLKLRGMALELVM